MVGTFAALPDRGPQRTEPSDLAEPDGSVRDDARRDPDVDFLRRVPVWNRPRAERPHGLALYTVRRRVITTIGRRGERTERPAFAPMKDSVLRRGTLRASAKE